MHGFEDVHLLSFELFGLEMYNFCQFKECLRPTQHVVSNIPPVDTFRMPSGAATTLSPTALTTCLPITHVLSCNHSHLGYTNCIFILRILWITYLIPVTCYISTKGEKTQIITASVQVVILSLHCSRTAILFKPSETLYQYRLLGPHLKRGVPLWDFDRASQLF